MNDIPPDRPRRVAGFNVLDLAGSCIVILLGAFVVAESANYEFGTLQRVGPGIFPMLLGILLIGLGVALTLESRLSLAVPSKVPVRATLSICASLAAFALLIDRAGAYVAITVMVLLAGLADDTKFRPLQLIGVAAGLCLFVTALVLGFRGQINIDLLPRR